MANRSTSAKKAWKTRGTMEPIETEVVAQLPLKVDLTKRTSGNELCFDVKSGGVLLGRFQMGRGSGSVQWFAPKAKKPTGTWAWKDFANLMRANSAPKQRI